MNLHATPSQMPRLSVSSMEWTCYLIIWDEPDSTCFPCCSRCRTAFQHDHHMNRHIEAYHRLFRITFRPFSQHRRRRAYSAALRRCLLYRLPARPSEESVSNNNDGDWKDSDDFSFCALPLYSRRAEQAPSTQQFASAVQCVAFLNNTHTVLAITRSLTYALRVWCKELRLLLAARRTYTVIGRNHRCMTRTCALRWYQQHTRQQRHCSNTGINARD